MLMLAVEMIIFPWFRMVNMDWKEHGVKIVHANRGLRKRLVIAAVPVTLRIGAKIET